MKYTGRWQNGFNVYACYPPGWALGQARGGAARLRRAGGQRGRGVALPEVRVPLTLDVKVILTPSCIFH
jgi:hypothetical protein